MFEILDDTCIMHIMEYLMHFCVAGSVYEIDALLDWVDPVQERKKEAAEVIEKQRRDRPAETNPCPKCGTLNPSIVRDGGSFGCNNCGQVYHRCRRGTVGPQGYKLGSPGPMFCVDCKTHGAAVARTAKSIDDELIADAEETRTSMDTTERTGPTKRIVTKNADRKRGFMGVLSFGLTCRRLHDIAIFYMSKRTAECAGACFTSSLVQSRMVGPWFPRMMSGADAKKIDPDGILELCLSRSDKALEKRCYKKSRAAKALMLHQIPRLGSESPLGILSWWVLRDIIANHC